MDEGDSRGRGECLTGYWPWQLVASWGTRLDGIILAGDISSMYWCVKEIEPGSVSRTQIESIKREEISSSTSRRCSRRRYRKAR